MLGRMLGQRLGSLQGGLVLLSDGPGEGHVSTWRRGVGKITIGVALVEMLRRAATGKAFEKTSLG